MPIFQWPAALIGRGIYKIKYCIDSLHFFDGAYL